MSQPRNPSWLYFPKLPYILQAYQHTCLQRNEAGERVSSRMVGTGKSILFSQAHQQEVHTIKKSQIMRKELFNAIKTKLANDVPEVKHIDLWNHNVEFIEQKDGWERPAVFVEFATIEWAPFQGGVQRGKGIVSIHIVTDWTEGEYDAAFDISRKIHSALDGLCGENFNGMALASTNTNHNHEEILESIDNYAVRYLLR